MASILRFYQKSFDISNMGVTSLTSHASRKKHSQIQISQSSNIGAAFFGKSNKNPASKESQKRQRTVESILVPVSTLRADFFLTFKVASSHSSLRLCLRLNELFRSMFTDSKIVKPFQLSKTKCGYIMNFGLPHISKTSCFKKWKHLIVSEFHLMRVWTKILQEECAD